MNENRDGFDLLVEVMLRAMQGDETAIDTVEALGAQLQPEVVPGTVAVRMVARARTRDEKLTQGPDPG